LKIRVYTVTLVLLSVQIACGQAPLELSLSKEKTGRTFNTISFELPVSSLNRLHDAKGEKLTLKVPRIIINNDTLKIKHIHVRGNTSSYFRRKSFNIKTNKKSSFHSGRDTFSLTKFYAISMNMDRNYVRNKIALAVLKLQGVQTPSNGYSNLKINNASEGLYLIFYPPDEYAMKKCNAPFVVRRGYGETMDKVYVAKGVDRQQVRDLKQKFRSLYTSSTLKKNGEDLYRQISSVLDLNSYFRWLAFNHLFQNGDYADEVYFMWNAEKLVYETIPWDFDDILESQPHEGASERLKSNGGKLIFSLEDELDKKIANDPYLYNEYLKVYSAFLEILTSEKLKELLTGIFDEVYPYYLQEQILDQSQFDQYGKTALGNLETDLNNIYQTITNKSITLRQEIETSLNK
jgi:spore coat protein H